MTRSSPGARALRLVLTLAAALLLGAGVDAHASHLTPLVGDRATPWAPHLRAMERALDAEDGGGALRAWHAAYVAALESPRWEGMVDVGDAYLRVGAFLRSPERVKGKARELYLAALLRARQERSTEGALRVASAFGALGDAEVVDQCLRVVRQLEALQAGAVGGVDVRDPRAAGAAPARSRSEGP